MSSEGTITCAVFAASEVVILEVSEASRRTARRNPDPARREKDHIKYEGEQHRTQFDVIRGDYNYRGISWLGVALSKTRSWFQ